MKGGDNVAEKLFAGLTYEQAVRKFSDTVTGVCIMRLQNFADAEDCYQNVFSSYTINPPNLQVMST